MKFDFKAIVDAIFKNKSNYQHITDDDKNEAFFIINRKFAVGELEKSQEYNNKFIDRASALDLWNIKYKKTTFIPNWYWLKSDVTKEKKRNTNLSKEDIDLLKKCNPQLDDKDIQFLWKYYKEDILNEIKTNKKLYEQS
jgi:hypothetical protein